MAKLQVQPRLQDRRVHIRETRTMSDFWWIIMANWTFEERAELRAAVEAWMALEVKR